MLLFPVLEMQGLVERCDMRTILGWRILMIGLFVMRSLCDSSPCSAEEAGPTPRGAENKKMESAKPDASSGKTTIVTDVRTMGAMRNQCGPLVVSAVAKFWGLHPSLSEIKDLTGYDYKAGTTIAGIRVALESLGLQTLSLKVTYPVLLEILDQNVPAIVGYGDAHVAVVLPPRKDGRVLVVDTAALQCGYVEREDFCRRWNQMAILTAPRDVLDLEQVVHRIRHTSVQHLVVAALPPFLGASILLGCRGWRRRGRIRLGA